MVLLYPPSLPPEAEEHPDGSITISGITFDSRTEWLDHIRKKLPDGSFDYDLE